MNRYIRSIYELIREAGHEPLSHELNKHLKVQCRTPSGNTFMVVFGCTPSDHRALKNARSVVRRVGRAADER